MSHSIRRAAHDAFRLAATVWGWIAFGGGCVVWALIGVPPTLVLRRVWPGAEDAFRSATRALLLLYVRTLPFMRIDVQGAERRLAGPRVLVANHQSYLDPIFLMALEPAAAGPARDDLFELPALGTVMRMVGFYPAGAQRTARGEAAAETRGLLFFPEGTRSRSGEVGRFQRGAFRTAFDRSLPIQPIVIEGMDRVLPPQSPVVASRFRQRVRVRYLEPLHPPYGEGLRRDVVRSLADRVQQEIVLDLQKARAEGASP